MSYLRNYFLTQVVRFTSMFSSKRMSVLVLTFRSLIQVNLSIVTWGRGKFLLCTWTSSYTSIACWKDYPFPIEWCWHPCWNQLTISVKGYFWTLDSIPLTCMSILMPVPHCLDWWNFVGSFEVGECLFFNLFSSLSVAGLAPDHQSMPQHRALRSDVLECNSQVEDTQPPSSLTSQPEGTALAFMMFRTELRGAGLLFPPSPLPHPASWSSLQVRPSLECVYLALGAPGCGWLAGAEMPTWKAHHFPEDLPCVTAWGWKGP